MDCGDHHSALTIGDALGNLREPLIRKRNFLTELNAWNFLHYGMLKTEEHI